MSDLDRFHQIANQIAAEELELPVTPLPWYARNTLSFTSHAYYLCCCGKGFTDIASKKAHQEWCRTHSTRESERSPSMQRMMGG